MIYLGTGLGDGTQVVDEVCFGHTDTGITDGEELILLVGRDADAELLAGVKSGRIGQGCITDFVEGVGAIGNQLPEEDLLVGVERVWDRVR